MRTQQWLAVLLLLLAGPTRLAFAQTDSGRISGTVRDQTSAWVAEATVTVKNEKTGETRSTTTNRDGFFAVSSLKPTMYTVTVTKQGFAPIEYKEMPVAVGQELALDFEFRLAGLAETVTVVGTAPIVDISSAKIGVNVSEREVQGLPINGRQMSQLMLQAPGSQNAGEGRWGDIRFSGRAVEQNVIKYDGVEASGIIDSAPGVANGENQSLFKLQASLENVQEFRVESSGYPAEFGTGTGGQVSVVTKSGGNRFTGSLFEYLRSDKMDAANYFDSQRKDDGSILFAAGSSPTVPKSALKLNQFGASTGGPLVKDRVFFFGSYEGYRLNAGRNLIQAVPSDAAWATTTVPAVLALRPAFAASGSHVLVGTSTDPLFDILQWQGTQEVNENAFGARVDFKINDAWLSYVRVFHDQAKSFNPEDVSGRRFHMTIDSTNAIYNLQGVMRGGLINEFKVGYNAAPSTEDAETSSLVQGIAISLAGQVANAGIAGQGANTGKASPGALVRVNSASNGRGAPYDPYSLTFADNLSKVIGTHYFKTGADVRLIRMTTDQLGGITYTFNSVQQFMANSPASIQYFGDMSEPSPFNNGATGLKHIRQDYYVGYAQDEWRANSKLTLNYGLRYDYYKPLREADNRIVKFNILTGRIDPNTTPFYTSKKNNLQPRLSATYAVTPRTVVKGGFGIFVGPGQTEDQIQPIEADRINTTATSGAFLAYPVDPGAVRANFTSQPNNRQFQPRAYSDDYILPEKVYQYSGSLQKEIGGRTSASIAYVGSKGRNLFLRSIANRTIGVQTQPGTTAALQIREFDILTCSDGTTRDGTVTPITSSLCGNGLSIASLQKPFAEVDYKTSGGDDTYNSMQLALTRRAAAGWSLNAQYTLASSKGTTGGSNEAATAGNNARAISDWEYDRGYNNFDVRHTFNASALYTIPGSGLLKGGWSLGGIAQARSGLPVEVLITRADIIYRDDTTGNYFTSAAAGRTAVINTPFGGSSRSRRRPDLVPGVDPYIQSGGLLFLNPAAFAVPIPGTFGNLTRNSIHGPTFWQVDAVVSKRMGLGGGRNAEFRLEVFNLLNHSNLAGVTGGLPAGLPTNTTSTPAANTIQPGQAFSSTTTGLGTFGKATSTVGSTVGIGTNRQVQLAFRLSF